MKKLSLLLVVICCFILTGCGNNEIKEVSTVDNFTTVTTKYGLASVNVLNNYKESTYITDSVRATLNDMTIEMVIYDSEENAIKAQDNQISQFKNVKSVNSTSTKEKGKNYYKYIMVSNGYYMVTSRIDNTLIFSKTLLTNQSTIENILNDMGY